MANRTVEGVIYDLTETPCTNEALKFRLVSIGADAVVPGIFKTGVKQVLTDGTGYFSVQLWTNENSLLPTRYRLVFNNGDQFEFDVPAGATPINIVDLIENTNG